MPQRTSAGAACMTPVLHSQPMPPFGEDLAVCQLAEDLGFELIRYDGIQVTDEAELKAAGLMRQCPDYSRIRKLLLDGVQVPGVREAGVEYKLKRTRSAA